MRKSIVILLSLVSICVLFSQEIDKPKNIIFLIGDGMGLNYVTTSVLTYDNDQFKKFPYTGIVTTCSADKLITDSAAAGTALATGHKTKNGYVGIDPDGNELQNICEFAEIKGMSTGIVVTSHLTDATPSCFIAHIDSRKKYDEIAQQYLLSDVDIVIGGGLMYFVPESMDGIQKDELNLIDKIKEKNYDVFYNFEELSQAKLRNKFYAILSKEGLPPAGERNYTLGQLTSIAIDNLKQDEDGFFLMVEGSQIDWMAHLNDDTLIANELKDFNSAIGVALDFAKSDGKTLVIVTADHETGGMSITGGNLSDKKLSWSYTTKNHTPNIVGVFSYGPSSNKFTGILDNTDIGKIMFDLFK